MMKAVNRILFRLILCISALVCIFRHPGWSDITNTTMVQGVNRLYIVHTPTNYNAAIPTPVLFMFHGHYGTAQGAAAPYYNWQAVADSNTFIVVFPDSLSPPGKNIDILGTIIVTNYDLVGKRWDIGHIQSNRYTSQDIEFTADILDWLEGNYNIRTSHVFTTGHSYGAIFSYYAAVCLSNRVTAFAEHSGGLTHYNLGLFDVWWPIDVPADSTKPAGMMLHSPSDTVVPYSNSVLLYTQMTNYQHTSELITLPSALNHAWDAPKNQMQWNFFIANAPVIDDDADGMPDAWEIAHNLNTGTNDATMDADQDGMNNLNEYYAGTFPDDSNSVFQIQQLVVPVAQQLLLQWTSVTNKTYSIEQSVSIRVPFTNLVADISATPPLNTHTTICTETTGVFRIKVTEY